MRFQLRRRIVGGGFGWLAVGSIIRCFGIVISIFHVIRRARLLPLNALELFFEQKVAVSVGQNVLPGPRCKVLGDCYLASSGHRVWYTTTRYALEQAL